MSMASFSIRHVIIMEKKKEDYKQELHRIAECPAYVLKRDRALHTPTKRSVNNGTHLIIHKNL
jgi:hypothetical protein